MLTRSGWVLAALFLVLPAHAFADGFPFVQHGPTITGVTANDAWITWYTAHHEGTGTQCTLEEDTPLFGDHNTDLPTVTLNTGPVLSDTNCDRYHRVHLTGLSANTSYSFVLDKPWDPASGATAHGKFTTAPDLHNTFGIKFVVYGDTRNDLTLGGTDTRADHQALVDGILAHDGDAAFYLHTGDMALSLPGISGDDKGYTEFFEVERTLLANHAVFIVLGNHETIDTTFFDAMFDPARYDGAPGNTHPYYSSFDWGRAHLAMGDSFEGTPTTLGLGGLNPGISLAQTEWMDADLQSAQAHGQASFLAMHQGPFSHVAAGSSGHGGLQDAVTNFIPLMLRYGALATFAGHDHYYQRGHEGCIDYLVLGGGGAPMYAPDSSAPGVISAQKTLSYMVVNVGTDGSASMKVKGPAGNTLDTFQFVTPDPGCVSDGGTAPADAGSNDAGSNDAGAHDAGSSDAGSNDAGTHDAGTHDAGTADAGAPAELIKSGCGCSSTGDGMFEGLALVCAFAFRRRRAA
jgi:MYXO-CTERM domain-containing protein